MALGSASGSCRRGSSAATSISLLGAAFFSIGLLTLVGNLRPYLFNSMLAIPDDIQGRVSAGMDVVSEIPALLLSGLVGAASDKLGRRAIYAMGFLILAVGYFLFPFVADDWTLYGMVFITACGASLVSAMLSTVIADYPRETSRGQARRHLLLPERAGRRVAGRSRLEAAPGLPGAGVRRLRGGATGVLDHRGVVPRADGDRGTRAGRAVRPRDCPSVNRCSRRSRIGIQAATRPEGPPRLHVGGGLPRVAVHHQRVLLPVDGSVRARNRA